MCIIHGSWKVSCMGLLLAQFIKLPLDRTKIINKMRSCVRQFQTFTLVGTSSEVRTFSALSVLADPLIGGPPVNTEFTLNF